MIPLIPPLVSSDSTAKRYHWKDDEYRDMYVDVDEKVVNRNTRRKRSQDIT